MAYPGVGGNSKFWILGNLKMSFQISGQAPWRNNNLTFLNKDHPVSEHGETIIGFYLLILGMYGYGVSSLNEMKHIGKV